jgi:putative FmdB family regulatory protein
MQEAEYCVLEIPMPLFEYRCETCGQRFEKLHKAEDAALPACPACGGTAATKLISSFSGIAPSSAGCFSSG